MPQTDEDKTAEQPKRRVSAERLYDQIAATEADLVKTQARFDRAEAEAIDFAGDPPAYRRAAAAVSKIKSEVDDLAETLGRLRKAHALAIESELDDEIAALRARRDSLDTKREAIVAEAEEAIIAEAKRHDEAIVALNKTARDSELAVAEIEIEISTIELTREQDHLAAAEAQGDATAIGQHRSWIKMYQAALDGAIGRRGESIRDASPVRCSVCGRRYVLVRGRYPLGNPI